MVMLDNVDDEKPFKQLFTEFQELRRKIFIAEDNSQTTISSFKTLQEKLLKKLEEKMNLSKAEIVKAENKKNNLIKRLVVLEKIKDRFAEDEIIKELEEYSRIRRHRDAQIARIIKEIADITLTEDEFHNQLEDKQKRVVLVHEEPAVKH